MKTVALWSCCVAETTAARMREIRPRSGRTAATAPITTTAARPRRRAAAGRHHPTVVVSMIAGEMTTDRRARCHRATAAAAAIGITVTNQPLPHRAVATDTLHRPRATIETRRHRRVKRRGAATIVVAAASVTLPHPTTLLRRARGRPRHPPLPLLLLRTPEDTSRKRHDPDDRTLITSNASFLFALTVSRNVGFGFVLACSHLEMARRPLSEDRK